MPDARKSSSDPPRTRRSTAQAREPRAAPVEEGAAGAGNYRAVTQDKLGQALSDLLENPLVTGAIGRAWGAREKAAQAQEIWMGALNLPSAADIERLTRRLRSVSQRLEGVEDGVQRLSRSIVQSSGLDARLQTIDDRLGAISDELHEMREAIARLASAERTPGAARPVARTGAARAGSSSGPPARVRQKR